MTARRVYGGRSADERSGARRELLIDSALELGDTIGWRNVTVERVCSHARLNKRYFYENFATLEELAGAAVDQVVDGVQSFAMEEFDLAKPIPELAASVLGKAVEYLTDDPRRARLLFGELAATDIGSVHRARAIGLITEFVVARSRTVHHAGDRDDSIIRPAAILLVTGTGQIILSWLAGELGEASRGSLIDDIAALWTITGNGAAAHAMAHQEQSAALAEHHPGDRNPPD